MKYIDRLQKLVACWASFVQVMCKITSLYEFQKSHKIIKTVVTLRDPCSTTGLKINLYSILCMCVCRRVLFNAEVMQMITTLSYTSFGTRFHFSLAIKRAAIATFKKRFVGGDWEDVTDYSFLKKLLQRLITQCMYVTCTNHPTCHI